MSLAYFFLFASGAMVGSFLNVCIYRLPRDLSLVSPSSSCTSCNRKIAWHDNIPIVSFFVLGGKCRHCGERFSLRYVIVECMTGFLFALVVWTQRRHGAMDVAHTSILLWTGCVLIVATFVDLELFIIPDEVTKAGMLLAPIASGLIPDLHARAGVILSNEHANALCHALLGMLAGAGLVYFVGVIGKLIFRKDAMGFGDVKLMGFLGALLGWKAILIAFFLACLLGSFFGVAIWLISRSNVIPFGPYLSAAGMLLLLFSHEIEWLLLEAYPRWIASWMAGGSL